MTDTRDIIARAVDAGLDASFDAWMERWTNPAGVFEDAPPPPKRLKTSPEKLAQSIEQALDAAGLVVVPKVASEAMIHAGMAVAFHADDWGMPDMWNNMWRAYEGEKRDG